MIIDRDDLTKLRMPQEVAEFLGICVKTARVLMKSGEIRS